MQLTNTNKKSETSQQNKQNARQHSKKDVLISFIIICNIAKVSGRIITPSLGLTNIMFISPNEGVIIRPEMLAMLNIMMEAISTSFFGVLVTIFVF